MRWRYPEVGDVTRCHSSEGVGGGDGDGVKEREEVVVEEKEDEEEEAAVEEEERVGLFAGLYLVARLVPPALGPFPVPLPLRLSPKPWLPR
jgi:hypothetical protein